MERRAGRKQPDDGPLDHRHEAAVEDDGRGERPIKPEKAANTFEELNITGKTTDAVILQLADRFKEMPAGAEKAALAVDLFGRSGLDLIPILNKGSEGFKESMEAAKRFGAVLSDTTLSVLSGADDAFDRLGVATKSVSYQFAGLMAPAVSSHGEAHRRGWDGSGATCRR